MARARAIARGIGVHRQRPTGTSRGALVVGHRGAAREEAENTLPSFGRAVELGADAIEADICITRDRRFVVWHDADPNERVALARQAGLEKLRYRPQGPDLGSPWRRPVRELTLDELRRHYSYVPSDDEDAGGPGSGTRAEPIPLDDLLEWASGEARLTDLFLDVKLDESQTRDAAGLVEFLEETASGRTLPVIHLLSPCEPVIRQLAKSTARCRDRLRVSADFELPGADRLAPPTGACDVSLGCGERLWIGFRGDVEACVRRREQGVFGCVVAWTVNDPKNLRRLVRDGVDGILTDDVALLRRIVESDGHVSREAGGGRQNQHKRDSRFCQFEIGRKFFSQADRLCFPNFDNNIFH